MLSTENSTSTSGSATPIDWRAVVDGHDGLYDHAVIMTRHLYVLMDRLETCLSANRGRVTETGITLVFQQDGIDANLWLVSEAWQLAKSLREKIEAVQAQMEAAEVAT